MASQAEAVVRFDLDDRHVDTWREQVCDQLLDADTTISPVQTLGVTLGITAVAGVVHLDCRASRPGLTLGRSRTRVARAASLETMGLSVVTSGEAQIQTAGGTHVLRAGELCLLSSREAFTKVLSGNYREQFLYLPVPVALALGRPAPVMSQRVIVAPRQGLGSVLADAVDSLSRARTQIAPAEWSVALGAIFELASGVFGRNDAMAIGRSTREVNKLRAERFIDDHLADPTLCPPMIAHAIGVSLRYLHLLFESGPSVGATIVARRLDRCKTQLLDPGSRHQSVSEIAFRWGFNDAAHFSRAFRARFGVAPRDLRRCG